MHEYLILQQVHGSSLPSAVSPNLKRVLSQIANDDTVRMTRKRVGSTANEVVLASATPASTSALCFTSGIVESVALLFRRHVRATIERNTKKEKLWTARPAKRMLFALSVVMKEVSPSWVDSETPMKAAPRTCRAVVTTSTMTKTALGRQQ